MTENLETALTELINSSLSTAEDAKVFLAEQMPEVVQQLLLWKAVYSGIVFWLSFLSLVFISSKLYRAFLHSRKKNEGTYDAGSEYLLIIPAAVVAMTLLPAIFTSTDWLEIIIAPKLYLLEYARSLAK